VFKSKNLFLLLFISVCVTTDCLRLPRGPHLKQNRLSSFDSIKRREEDKGRAYNYTEFSVFRVGVENPITLIEKI
jgi:hypothetical protein